MSGERVDWSRLHAKHRHGLAGTFRLLRLGRESLACAIKIRCLAKYGLWGAAETGFRHGQRCRGRPVAADRAGRPLTSSTEPMSITIGGARRTTPAAALSRA